MKNLATTWLNSNGLPALSVSYKSPNGLSQLLNTLPEAIIVTDVNFNITGLNPVAESMYGFTSGNAMGKRLFDLVQVELIGINLEDAIQELYTTGCWNGDIIYYPHPTHKLYFNTRCTLIKDDAGTTTGIVLVNQNISEKVKKEKDFTAEQQKYNTVIESLSEGVILINANGSLGASNKKAAEILGVSEDQLKGAVLANNQWKAFKEDGSIFPVEEFPAIVTLQTGEEKNNVVMELEKANGERIWISINSRAIHKERNQLPEAVVVSFTEITNFKKVNEKLSESELLFRTFMKNSPTLAWIYDEEGKFVYGNPRFMEIVGLTDESLGKSINEIAAYDELREMIFIRNNEVLQKGAPIIGEDAVPDKEGNVRHYLSYWFLLPLNNEKKLIGGNAVEITDTKIARREMDKMYERYTYVVNASSDAIWDLDLSTNAIYRSDAFNALSGYTSDDITPTLDWWFLKIHPQDKKRVKERIDHYLQNNITHWENEYRFQIADGSYKHLLDKAFAIYENGRLTRVIGAMQDMTERKKLEASLLDEQVQKQKLISQATFTAQEKERNRISAELHDNVNQLLMSAKLHIGAAKNNNETQDEMLSKASEYLLLAVEEIRDLSRSLNSSVINVVGLQKSVNDIADSMKLSKDIEVQCLLNNDTIEKMSDEQQLMVYRIIQEQSNNILKYSEATEAMISLKQTGNKVDLLISDNGKGFDKNEKKATGIGFINIFNRIDAYNGKVNIITSPGNGCTLHISFPLT